MINIGDIIKDHCHRHKISIYTLASQMHISPPTLYKTLKDNDMSLSRLHQISNILNHNFFTHFIHNTGSSEEQLLKLSTDNRELTSKVASLQKEITYLQEINNLLKARQ